MIASPARDTGSLCGAPRIPLDAAWQSAVLALHVSRRGKPDDPLAPFIAWCQLPENRIARDQAFKIARAVRVLLRLVPIDDLLASTPGAIAGRVPRVAGSAAVGDGYGKRGKPYRQAVRLLQDWEAKR